jgi:peptide/nickel transport system substrate-binding protein
MRHDGILKRCTAPPRPLARLAGVLLVTAAGAGCAGDQAERTGARGVTAVVCLQKEPTGLNAFTSMDVLTADLTPVLFTPLVRYDAAGAVQPWLATSWSWSTDRRSVTIELRPDVRWHDGEPVTAGDVIWTIETAADPEFGYFLIEDFEAFESARARGPNTVELRFSEPSPLGLEGFVGLPILPRHLLADIPAADFRNAPYHRAPTGSGPFRLAGRTSGGDLLFERFEDFPADMGEPGLERLLIRAVPEMSTQLVQLQTGEVHACVMGASAAQQVAAAGSLTTVVLGRPTVVIMPLRNDRQPFDDVLVRRAVSAAIDRSEIARVISPAARPAASFLPADSPFRDDSLNQTDADLALAAAQLDSAGWSLNGSRDGIRRNGSGEPLSFTIFGPQSYDAYLTSVQAQLRRAGMDARISLLEGSTYFAMIDDPDTRPAAMAVGLSPSKVNYFDPYPELHSEGHGNLSVYRSPGVDSLVQALRGAAEEPARRRVYQQLQRRIAQDVPSIYTIYIPRLFVHGPQLQGVRGGPGGPFSSVIDWRLDR